MRLSFLALPPDERHVYIDQAAIRRNISPVLLEKDFWVCWLLGLLFGSEFAGSLVFKGGTSLSKVFGVIGRFSEDIDLSLSPAFLKLPEAGTSRNQANKWMTRAEAACARAVKTQIAPALEAAAEAVLGQRDGGWFEFLTDAHTNSPVLLFHYPSSQPAGFEYRKRAVKLEFGSLTDQQPVGRHPGAALGGEYPPHRISRLGVRSRGAGGGAEFLGRRRSSTPSTTGRPTSRHPTGSPATTRTRLPWPRIRRQGGQSTSTTSGMAL
jgi:hypothetical protein